MLFYMQLMNVLRKNLKDLRERKGWKQADLAEAAGFSREHIARIESKEGGSWVSAEFVTAIASAFGEPESRLFLDSDHIPSPTNKQVLDVIRDALMERDMLRNLQKQGAIPANGSKEWNEMIRAGLQNRPLIETAEDQFEREDAGTRPGHVLVEVPAHLAETARGLHLLDKTALRVLGLGIESQIMDAAEGENKANPRSPSPKKSKPHR